MNTCPSHIDLATLHCGELASQKRAEIEQHIEGCTSCKERLQQLSKNTADYQQNQTQHSHLLRARLNQEARRQQPIRWRWPLLGVFAASAFSLTMLLMFVGPKTPPTATKGPTSVQVVVKRGSQQFTARQGVYLQEQDALRFVLSTAQSGFVAVFALEQGGQVSHYYPNTDPEQDPQPMAIDHSGATTLEGSVVLDDSLGQESIVTLFSPQSFDRAQLQQRVTDYLQQHNGAHPSAQDVLFDGDILILQLTKRVRSRP